MSQTTIKLVLKKNKKLLIDGRPSISGQDFGKINAGFIQVSYHIFFSYMYICLVLRIMYMKKILEHLMHYILHHKHTSASHIYSSSMNQKNCSKPSQMTLSGLGTSKKRILIDENFTTQAFYPDKFILTESIKTWLYSLVNRNTL